MNQAVQVTRRFLNLLAQVIIRIEIENIRHEIERILIVGHLGVQAGQVEAIGQVFFVNLAEILIATRRNELFNLTVRHFQNDILQPEHLSISEVSIPIVAKNR